MLAVNKYLQRVFIVLGISYSINLSHAQLEGNFYHLDYSKGLTNLFIRSIVQDNDGFIWVGTEDGLFRYDGYEFRAFHNLANNANSLSDNYINHLLVDSNGTLWVATQNGLNIYNSKNENFLQILEDKENQEGLPNKLVEKIFEDKEGNIWIGHYDGFSRVKDKKIDPKDLAFENFRYHKESNVENWIRSICEDKDGNLWFGAYYRSVYKLNKSTNEIKNYYNPELMPRNFRISSIITDNDDNLLIWSFKDYGVLKYEAYSDAFQSYPIFNTNKYNGIINVFLDSNKNLWIATNNGLVLKQDTATEFLKYNHDAFNLKSIASNSVQCLFEDNTGNLWIGTTGKGLDMFAQPSISILNVNKNTYPSMPENRVEGMVYADGALYFASQILGIYRFKHNEITRVVDGYANPIVLFDGKRLFSERTFINLSTGIEGKIGGFNIFNVLCVDLDNNINFLSDKYFVVYNAENKTVERKVELIYPGNIDDDIQVLKMAVNYKGKNIFLDKKNLLCLSDTLGKLETILKSQELDEYFKGFDNMYLDSNNCWLTSKSTLYKFDFNTGLLKIYNEDKLWGDKIYSIITDSNHDIWLSTNKGVILLLDGQNKSYLFDKSDGISTYSFSNAVAKSPDDKIYFSTGEGIVIIDKKTFITNSTLPEIAFTKFQLLNTDVGICGSKNSDSKYCLQAAINKLDEINLKYNQNYFSIEFAAINYKSSSKNQYKYYLEGIEKNWRNIGSHRVASYNGIPPGEYTFKVIASNDNGVWNNTARELRITIKPPFWRTNWFRILIIFGIGLVLSIVYKIRINAINKQKDELEKQVRLRTVEVVGQKEEIQTQADNLKEINVLLKENQEEIQVQSEELYEANTELQKLNSTKDKFFSIIAHDLKNPFQAINGFSEVLLKDFKMLDEKKMQEFIGFIRNSSKTASSLLENLLEWARTQTSQIKFEPQIINIHDLAQESLELLNINATSKKIKLVNNIPTNLQVYADMNMITTVFRNLLNNAIKFTPEQGMVSFFGKNDGNMVEIVLEDTGVGMDEKTISKLFRIDQQISTSGTSGESGTGLGLIITKEFIDKSNGSIFVESTINKGSRFIMHLPDKNEIKPKQHEVLVEELEVIAEDSFIEDSKKSNEVLMQDRPLLLIVEDTLDLRIGIKAYLENDYKIVEAGDGEEGMKFALDLIPDIIISDWMMPKMDGIELTRKLKTDTRTSHIPVVMLTAKSTPKNRIEGYETGADEYMVKPFDYNVLKVRLKNLIKSRIDLQKIFSTSTEIKTQYSSSLSKLDQKFLDKLEILIIKNLDNSEFVINEQESLLEMTRTQIYRKIKALTGVSPTIMLRNFRLKEAAKMLKEKQLTVSEVMYSVGFNHASYFTRSFKEVYGCIPTEY